MSHTAAYVVLREASKSKLPALLQLNGWQLEGKHLRVDAQVGGGDASSGGGGGGGGGAPKYEPRRTVFVGNMSYSQSEEGLRAFFAERIAGTIMVAASDAAAGSASASAAAGTVTSDDGIESVRIVRDRATNAGKGFGFVCFASRTAVVEALAANGAMLNGRALRVTRCTPDGLPPGAAGAAARGAVVASASGGGRPLPRHMGIRAHGKPMRPATATSAATTAPGARLPGVGKTGKPKHAARKARQAAEAAAAAAAAAGASAPSTTRVPPESQPFPRSNRKKKHDKKPTTSA
jgi:nucleolar protein 12